MIRRILYSLILFMAWSPVQAAPLVSDLSQYRINMDANFSGSRLFLFGARNDNGDVVVVIRGPMRDFIVRKKEPIGGIWVNRGRMKLFNLPDFYVMASSRPLAEIEQTNVFRQLGIGQENLLEFPADPRFQEEFPHYSQAFFDYQHAQKRYSASVGKLTFMAETLFKTTIEFPDNIPPGNYTAEIYLVSDGAITGMQTIPITVRKSGLDAFLYAYAHDRPALYGLTAVVLALVIGWFAGRVFEKI